MVGVAGAVAQALFRWGPCRDNVHWPSLMSESDWRVGMIRVKQTTPDRFWRRAATLTQKNFDPELRGDLWPAVCRCAADIRHKFALTEKPLEAVIHDQQQAWEEVPAS